jgi:hypothetical protein
MNRAISLASLACLLWAAPVFSQDAVAIKFKKATAGASIVVVENNVSTEKLSFVTPGKDVKDKNGVPKGKIISSTQAQTGTVSSNVEYTEKVREVDDQGVPVLIERAYAKATAMKNKEPEKLNLAGKTVIIEKIAGGYAFFINGDQKLQGLAAEMLRDEFADIRDAQNLERLFLPKTPVKLGMPWKLDMAAIAKAMPNDDIGVQSRVDPANARGTGVLTKTYQKAGKQFGVVEFKLEFRVKSFGAADDKITFAEGAKEVTTITYDGCIDGTSDAGVTKIKIELRGTGTHPEFADGMVMIERLDEIHRTVTESTRKK